MLTNDLFKAFIQCKTKFYLLMKSTKNLPHAFSEFQKAVIEEYRKKCIFKSMGSLKESQHNCHIVFSNIRQIFDSRYHFNPIKWQMLICCND